MNIQSRIFFVQYQVFCNLVLGVAGINGKIMNSPVGLSGREKIVYKPYKPGPNYCGWKELILRKLLIFNCVAMLKKNMTVKIILKEK
jgi:hypothetical protein